MKALALDFDGVVCDGSREVLAVALDAYAELEPGSALALAGDCGRLDPALLASFLALVPLGNRAEDFGVALRAIELRLAIPDQKAYDAFFTAQDEGWRDAFHSLFYEHRRRLRELDLRVWLELHRPYPELLELLARRAGEVPYAIATAKDRESVHLILESFEVGELFPEALVLDKERWIEKTAHLRALADALSLDPAEIVFVDDKVRHLARVAVLGVRPVLAGWGHNGEREHAEARRLGFAVASLADAEAHLFSGAG